MKIAEILDTLVDLHQLVEGWHADICWSPWDSECFEKLKKLLRAANDHKEGRAELVEEKFTSTNNRSTPFRCPQCGKEHFPKQVYCGECCEGM